MDKAFKLVDGVNQWMQMSTASGVAPINVEQMEDVQRPLCHTVSTAYNWTSWRGWSWCLVYQAEAESWKYWNHHY